jgi:hypothetical protein
MLISIIATYICNILFLFHYLNFVFKMKERYSHLNRQLINWINGTGSRPINLKKEKWSCFQSDRTVDHVYITPLRATSVGNIEGTWKQFDIHLLRQIHSELYDISCLINDTYGIPILASICWILTTVLCCLYEALINFNAWGVTDIAYAITGSVLVFNVTFIVA